MKKIYFITLQTLFITTYAQVGINIDNPRATLDVASSPNDTTRVDGFLPPRLTAEELKRKDNLYTDEHKGAIVYVHEDPQTDFLSSLKTEKVISSGLFHFDGEKWQKLINTVEEIANTVAPAARNIVYAAQKAGGWRLLDSQTNGWSKVGLTGLVDTEIGTPSQFTNGTYTVPVTGVYMVNYEWQLSAGVDLSVLSSRKMGILVNNVLAEEKTLNGVRVALGPLNVATVPVTSTNLFKIVQLSEGDELSFVTSSSGISVALLRDIRVKLSVHKISD